jgi:hypothetical protein
LKERAWEGKRERKGGRQQTHYKKKVIGALHTNLKRYA